jgi:hypothetical protein
MIDKNEVELFLANALIKLPGASVRGLKTEMFPVLKEFFSYTNAWTEDIVFQAIADEQNYALVPVEGQIIRLVGVWDDKGIIIPAFMQDFGTIRLYTRPTTTPTTTWFARVIKNVTLPTTMDDVPVAPDWTLRVYGEHILDGLLGRMMMQKDKSFTDLTTATYHLKRFLAGQNDARMASKSQNLQGAQSWAFPQGTRGSQHGGVSTAWPSRVF